MITGPSQAAKDAAAVVKPTYFKKSLREVAEVSRVSLSPKKSSVGMFSTNSFLLSVSTTELSFSSSTLFQYFLIEAIYLLLLVFSFCRSFSLQQKTIFFFD